MFTNTRAMFIDYDFSNSDNIRCRASHGLTDLVAYQGCKDGYSFYDKMRCLKIEENVHNAIGGKRLAKLSVPLRETVHSAWVPYVLAP